MASAQGTNPAPRPVRPQGIVTPSWGSVSPFWGSVSPFWGSVSPFWGSVSPFWGSVSPFWGSVSPFWGSVSPFWGSVSPFWGSVSPFWGSVSPFGGAAPADGIIPQWGNINAFWGDVNTRWGSVSPFWGSISPFADPSAYQPVADQLKEMMQHSADFWGATVQQKTGKSFQDGFAQPLLVKYGIDLNDPSTLAKLDVGQRNQFFVDWYDGLMNLSGTDRVDHWMGAVHWNPALSQVQGAGSGTVIGLLDFTVKDPDLTQSISKYTGVSDFSNGHGAAVASLMISAQDGKGVMGIAPRATVVAYNPFDATGTANWADITNGVKMLVQNRASIVNMSLGVPGYTLHPDWNGVFTDASLAGKIAKTVFVIAAGNEGASQTGKILWNPANPYFLVVGSVDPSGTISSFSNRPGDACLVSSATATCAAGNALRDRFIVAPGELILVSDDKGGTMRMSGTSLAAPLVSATIALLHDRWPWLATNPKATTNIILRSARDLGAPGVDDVYGVGLLDVTASQSPIDMNALRLYQMVNGKLTQQPLSSVQGATQETLTKWEADGAFFYAYEDIDGTFRDFSIPLSTRLVGGATLSPTGRQEKFQQYLYSRFIDWVGKTGTSGGAAGFASFTSMSAPVGNPYGVNMTMSMAPRTLMQGYRQSGMPYQTALQIADQDNRFAITAGDGDGAITLGQHAGFGLASDYDSDTGGANPLLGLASGGAYAAARYALSDRVQMSFGVTERSLRRDTRGMSVGDQLMLGGIPDNRSSAEHVAISYRMSPAITVNAGYTRLRENTALLGTQSVDRADLAGGSTTDGATIGMNVAVTSDLNIAASGTVGRTQANGRQNIAVGNGGLLTSSYEVALTKNKLFDARDRIRFTFSQPMYLEQGKIDYTTVQVIDRQTGELGNVTQSFDISGKNRQFIGEMLYGRSLGINREVSLFGRARLKQGVTTDALPAYIAGARFRMGF
ncbi:S8 family peptidase [Sphingomonas quercus]|uniref:S8 family serine peptidase n=1 Tax=Sphingomonas quercus TaxID=2842451 RepID=A0ABS6BQ90_9SPHN|nr:S8 family peptidase [Sphingomonas quercus]MBU3079434.1 S8 family serine peptidase [Sphingomonas quercus]